MTGPYSYRVQMLTKTGSGQDWLTLTAWPTLVEGVDEYKTVALANETATLRLIGPAGIIMRTLENVTSPPIK